MEQAAEGTTPTVLYVDDEDLARKYFGRAFGNEYRVLTAPGVDAAIDLLGGHDVDVLVTDYRMPGRTGSDLLREVARAWPGLVCILVTAYADKEILLETVNGGDVFHVLEKPVRQDTLREALRRASMEAARRARDRAMRDHGQMAVEETVAFLSHELGAPLASIAAFARSLARQDHGGNPVDDDVPGRDDACPQDRHALPMRARIGNAAAHMGENARYCQSVLDSFVDAIKRASPAPAARAAGAGAQRMVEALLASYPMSAGERAAMSVHVQQDFAIRASPNCVALVLSSLVANALQALRGQSAPRLRVTVGAGGRPAIAVEDNGPGIAPEILHRLLLDPVSMHGEGAGWGLMFCHRVMQSFGGHLRVQSTQASPDHPERQRGTTATMNFPETQKEQA
ncbi:hybrid sensor histidine kinase/response regulator [Pseudoduganella lutea]|uniref:histidine kinase n=1 Tax=Pseudoduganella lutea TaxID=321985 RepID=A0A4P6L3S0_9BURK|nr:hybrid sensor histidine kinase/response regulator [Pseudoduganella lutea]QBE66191.1 hybrid sensor histidine kinase/response regulator [Pseudoduganella lutea]